MAGTNRKAGSAKTGSSVLSHFLLSQTFSLGFTRVRYYSVFFVSAIILGYLVARARAIKQGIQAALFDDIIFWTVVWGFVSARIYYVLFYFTEYEHNLSEIYKVWHGGLAIYGGLIGGAIALYFLTKRRGVKFFSFTDVVVFGLPLAQALGRFGNFFNYEAFGAPTNLPWKMYVPPQFRPAGYAQFQYFHPTFAYEAIWDVLTFAALVILAKSKYGKKYGRGLFTGAYFVLYSIGRFVIEGIRLDSAWFFGHIRGDQLTAVLLAIAGLAIIRFSHENKPQIS
ncbi:prolipoprotein diacylglyceryl transferase [Patescibacteria group bacterium]|nr:prolipoprotein diacylglyceryl transferase [Patescibacteria group bacterium]